MDFKEKLLASWCGCDLPEDKQEVYEAICQGSKVYVELIFSLIPECPERTLAIRRFQESLFWLHKALCCEECD